MNRSWIKHGESKIWWPVGTFFLRGLSFSWCLELIQRYRHHESKSAQLVIFSPVFLLCKLVSLDLLWANPLKKAPHFLWRVSALTTSEQNSLKICPLQAFTLGGTHQRVSKPTESSFSPSELSILWSPLGWHRGQHPRRDTRTSIVVHSFSAAPWKHDVKGWTLTSPGQWADIYKRLRSSPTPHTGAVKQKGKGES